MNFRSQSQIKDMKEEKGGQSSKKVFVRKIDANFLKKYVLTDLVGKIKIQMKGCKL